VLASGLAFTTSKPDDNTGTRRGKFLGGLRAGFAVVEFGRGKANLILQSDTVWRFSSRFVLTEAEEEFIKLL